MRLHHIGIVVNKISDSLKEISKYLEFREVGIPTNIGSQKVNVCFLDLGTSKIELIEPIGKDSPVLNFSNKGGGIHHLCFEVDDLPSTIAEMTKKGATLLVSPVNGFEDRLIAFLFLNMKNTNCNLIELAQKR